jgi:O-antigen/teichoic acid export membrane protein
VFATDFIATIYGAKYAGGGVALMILAAGFAVKNVLSVHNSILEAVGRSKTLSFNSVIAAVSNLLLNIVLIPQFGLTGAAVATVASFILRDGLATIQVYLTLETTPLTWRATRPVVLAVPFLLIISTVVAPATPSTFLWLVAVTGLASTAYAAVVLLVFGLSDTEVMVLRSAEEQYGLGLGRVDWLIRHLSER